MHVLRKKEPTHLLRLRIESIPQFPKLLCGETFRSVRLLNILRIEVSMRSTLNGLDTVDCRYSYLAVIALPTRIFGSPLFRIVVACLLPSGAESTATT